MESLHLHLILKHEFYDAIDRGEKTVEYRDNTPYWRKRIVKKWNSNGGNLVIFHRGYTKTIMVFRIKLLVLNTPKIELHLGERLTPVVPRFFPQGCDPNDQCDCGSSTCDQCNPGWEDEDWEAECY